MSKKVLITGGNKGIGLAISRAMLEFGYEIIIEIMIINIGGENLIIFINCWSFL